MRNRNEIGAIETVYDGYRFRSRLEARWAVFFKTARIRYIYEPECFRMPTDGELYLPDFYLPDVNMRTTEDKGGIYVEVKPPPLNFNTEEGKHLCVRLTELSWITGRSVLLIEGMPALWESYFDAEGYGHYEITITPNFDERWDHRMLFARCYKCFRVRVQHGWHQGPCEYCLKTTGKACACDAAHHTLRYAAEVARSYRFDNR
jgi:hypothetical protein